MNPEIVDKIEKWLTANAELYINKYPDDFEEYNLKLNHSFRVKNEIDKISENLKCSKAMIYTAQAAALLHDAGRFQQYAEYKTFSDAFSVDHAELGLKVIQNSGLLDNLEKISADRITFAVKNHNKYQISSDGDKEAVFLAKMLRDADKIDIFNVVSGYYSGNDSGKIAAMLNLPVHNQISSDVCRYILDGEIPKIEYVSGFSDLKLMQMSWIYDINFGISLEIIKEQGYLDLIYSSLEGTDEIKEIFQVLNNYLDANTGTSELHGPMQNCTESEEKKVKASE